MRTALPIAALLFVSLGAAAQAQADTRDAGPLLDAGAPIGGGPLDAGLAAPAPPPLAQPKPLPPIPAGLGRVSGRVTLNGPPPAPRPSMSVAREPLPTGGHEPGASAREQPMAANVASKDIRVCGLTQPDLSLQLGLKGGVLETVLWAADGPAPIRSAHPEALVEVEGCRFIPRVLVTTVGAELTLVNRDALYHNVTGTGVEAFSYALVLKDHDVPMRLKKPGLLVLESKLRPWMRGYVQALPTTAWATTDTDGTYFLDLPPGKHVIKLWHERLGEREETVDIAAGETTLKDFALTPK